MGRQARLRGPLALAIAGHVSAASAIYAWGLVPSRRFVTRNPLRLVEWPPNDEKPRTRVALAPEGAQLLSALDDADAGPLRHRHVRRTAPLQIARLEWPDVLDGHRIGSRISSRKSKTKAGTSRRPPIAEPLRSMLTRAWLRQGRPDRGRVLERSGMSGKLSERATAAWASASCTGSRSTNAGTRTRRC